MSQATLDDLLRRTALGDRRAFKSLYARTSPHVFALCHRVLTRRADAVLATRDAYLSLWRYSERFEPSGAAPMTFICAIARDIAVERLRSQYPPSAILEAAETTMRRARRADRKALAQRDAAKLRRCLAEAGAEASKLIRMAYFGGVTYRSLAARDGVSAGEVRRGFAQTLDGVRRCSET